MIGEKFKIDPKSAIIPTRYNITWQIGTLVMGRADIKNEENSTKKYSLNMSRYKTAKRSKLVPKYKSILKYRHWKGTIEDSKEADGFN